MSDTDKTRVSEQTPSESDDATLISFDAELTEPIRSNDDSVDASELDNDKTLAIGDITQVSNRSDVTEVSHGEGDDSDFCWQRAQGAFSFRKKAW